MVVRRSRARGGISWGRIIIALIVAAFSLISYFGSKVYNPVTDEDQYISMTKEQEIALGLQAAPEMAQEFGGLDPDEDAQAFLDAVCQQLTSSSDITQADWPFECHLLADPETINAFALPGGQVFITAALFDQLETEGQLAGVMAHEIGHVVARHGAEHLAKAQLTQGLTGAAVIATYDPNDPNSQRTAQVALLIGELINLKFSREDELESDRLGVRFMADAGYDPRSLIRVMEILAAASEGAGPPEFFSTHPNPDNRITRIQEAIDAEFPDGIPEGLIP
ncbi:MAG: M48 family metallopeptidase [Chloroflexi bacterium]|nr:M48 family metallopeptidase [Chloroflexota bacterium]MCI0581019.1 M48 family metallopeptidase [Chloroflexota bacterium]MCI0646358.1 M48 family metallopeptidase [Chloroflexota bacterium]MCI0728384.1 M48 family metallopeptidase [Chloroflexota bacterium]